MKRASLALIVAALLARPAVAQPPSAAAKPHLDNAKAHFNLQEYAQAETELKEAYRIDPRPETLYAIAQAERLNNDCEHAITSYQNFLRTSPRADQAQLAEDNIARCEADVKAHAAPPPEPAPPPPPAPVASPPPPAAPVAHASSHDWLALGLVGGGAVAAAGGLFVAHSAERKIDDINSAQFYDDFVSASEAGASAKSSRTVGLVVAGSGVALIAAGVIAHFRRAPSDDARVTVSVGAHDIGVAWAW